jgi:hypothetical protein
MVRMEWRNKINVLKLYECNVEFMWKMRTIHRNQRFRGKVYYCTTTYMNVIEYSSG